MRVLPTRGPGGWGSLPLLKLCGQGEGGLCYARVIVCVGDGCGLYPQCVAASRGGPEVSAPPGYLPPSNLGWWVSCTGAGDCQQACCR